MATNATPSEVVTPDAEVLDWAFTLIHLGSDKALAVAMDHAPQHAERIRKARTLLTRLLDAEKARRA